MSIIQKIEKLKQEVRKDPLNTATATFLSTLIAECQRNDPKFKGGAGYAVPDEVVVRTMKKMRSNAEETRAIYAEQGLKHLQSESEIVTLDVFIPKQLTEHDLVMILGGQGFTKLPEFMQFLKANAAGQYDGKLAKHVFDNYQVVEDVD